MDFLTSNMYYVIAAIILSAVIFYFTKDTVKAMLLGEDNVTQSPEEIAKQREAQLQELQSMEARRAEEIQAQLQAQSQSQEQMPTQDQEHED
jgi:Na+/H+ antiporter NhaC